MPDNIRIQILGLREFRRDLATANAAFPRELRKVFNKAGEVVANDARANVPKRSGDLARSIKTKSTQTQGRVVMGSDDVPYAGWIEFGGRVGKGRKGKGTGSVVRPRVKSGRYLYPAFVRHQLEVLATMEAALRELARKLD